MLVNKAVKRFFCFLKMVQRARFDPLVADIEHRHVIHYTAYED